LSAIDGALVLWFSLTALSVAYVAWDLTVRTPAMTVMKWGWVAVVAYTGPIGLFVYLLSCREPSPGSHEAYIAPLWKQSVGSTIHCLARDATGIIAASTITAAAGLPMGIDLIVEYAAGFAFGLLIFQALFMRDVLGGSYRTALRRTVLPEWLSMNNVMAGMAPRPAGGRSPVVGRVRFLRRSARRRGAVCEGSRRLRDRGRVSRFGPTV
jgi:hypothetical protein